MSAELGLRCSVTLDSAEGPAGRSAGATVGGEGETAWLTYPVRKRGRKPRALAPVRPYRSA